MFDLHLTTNVTSVVGGVARLRCAVHNLKDKTVRLNEFSKFRLMDYILASSYWSNLSCMYVTWLQDGTCVEKQTNVPKQAATVFPLFLYNFREIFCH